MNQKILGIVFGISAGAIWALETIIGKLNLCNRQLKDININDSVDNKKNTFLGDFSCSFPFNFMY